MLLGRRDSEDAQKKFQPRELSFSLLPPPSPKMASLNWIKQRISKFPKKTLALALQFLGFFE